MNSLKTEAPWLLKQRVTIPSGFLMYFKCSVSV